MKVFAIINVARQINGEMVFVKVERAFLNFQKAEDYIKNFPKETVEMVQNSNGFSIECSCLKSLYELEVEE